jgi:hypothetical protein
MVATFASVCRISEGRCLVMRAAAKTCPELVEGLLVSVESREAGSKDEGAGGRRAGYLEGTFSKAVPVVRRKIG